MTLQLQACLARVQLLAACNRESPARSICESLFFLHTVEHFFTLSHSLPLQEFHLNTGLLIAKIQANLARNKANKMVDKILPYIECLLYSIDANVTKYNLLKIHENRSYVCSFLNSLKHNRINLVN